MDNITPQTFPKKAPNPVLAGLPAYLKDPANFDKVQLQILSTLTTKCNHSELIEWANCETCTLNMLNRRKLLKKLGFKNAAQYLAWKKTHEIIKGRAPLPKYNTPL